MSNIKERKHIHPSRLCCRAISGSHLQFCCHRCSTRGPYSLGQAVQGSPRYGWRNPVSVQSMAWSPCQLDDDEHSEVEIIIPQSVIKKRNHNKKGIISISCFCGQKKALTNIVNRIRKPYPLLGETTAYCSCENKKSLWA